jgi:hypothetical protein
MRYLLVSLLAIMGATGVSAATWTVRPDGSGDVPTIQAAMDTAVAGDTVLVSCGTYYEHDIQVKNGIYFTSATGNPDCVTIDGQDLGRVLKCDFLDATTSIVGLTVMAGNVNLTGGYGGGLYCYKSNPRVTNCAFIDNSALLGGGAWVRESSPVFTNCDFIDNYVCCVDDFYWAMGGGVSISMGRPVFVNCIFRDNGSNSCFGGGVSAAADSVAFKHCLFEQNRGCGAAMYLAGRMTVLENCTLVANIAYGGASGIQFDYSAYASLEDCIMAFNENRFVMEWISAEPVEPLLTCCNLYGNEHGDWVTLIADQYGVRGNISEDPLFCDVDHSDYYLLPGSPCLDVDTCGTMGAYGECGFGITSVNDLPGDEGGQVNITWHRISFDSAGSDTVVDHYSVWRRSDTVPAAAHEAGQRGVPTLLSDPPGTWEQVYTATASGQATYKAACPTVCDSTEEGTCWQVFFVRAHCSAPVLEFDTQPDSGYSVNDRARPGEGWTDVTTSVLGSTDAGSGLAWVDYDNDGDLDIFFTNRVNQKNQLLVNQDLTHAGFVKDTPVALQDQTNSRGCPWGDYDGDGDLDVYISNKGSNKLFRNDGGGVFVDVTSSPLDDAGTGQTASWVDYDNDGDLDLYVVNNGTNKLFRNEGAGTFTDVTSGPLGDSNWGMGLGLADYDNDGDMDIYVANYDGANVLLENQGGTFVDVTTPVLESPLFSYAATWGDYDNDGDLDLYVTNEGANKLLRNDDSTFTDVTSYPVDNDRKGRGAAWGDYDNDGDLDLYLVNYNKENRLFRNEGGDSFCLNTLGCHWVEDGYDGFSTAWADYDQDGDLDLYVVNDQGDFNKLFRNELKLDRHWLEIDPVGVISNTDGVGVRVMVVAGGITQMREITSASGFASQGPLTARFGLGAEAVAETVEVTWPASGIVQVMTDVPGDQMLQVIETDLAGVISRRDIPAVFRLHPSRPNPFSALTAIRYDLPEAAHVDITIYDVSGRVVRSLLDERLTEPGYHTACWDGRNTEGRRVAPGVYFCRLSTGSHTGTERMLLLR